MNSRLIEAMVLTPDAGQLPLDLRGEIAGMVALAHDKAAPCGAAVRGAFESSVKVVAGRRNCLDLLFTAHATASYSGKAFWIAPA